DLTLVVTFGDMREPMVSVMTADRKANGTVAKTPGLALHTAYPCAVVDQQVTASVLAERHVDRESCRPKGRHHRESRAISDVLRMGHSTTMPVASAGPCPKETTRPSSTMSPRRSSSVGRATVL